MAQTITINQTEFDKRAKQIAEKSFILGVDWMCKLLIEADIYEFSQREAELFHKRAESVFAKVVK